MTMIRTGRTPQRPNTSLAMLRMLRALRSTSPNSAGMTIDCIRCAKLALDRGIGGPLLEISAFTMKHPPKQMRDSEARVALERWIAGK